jgi:hypothetical protein
MKDGKFLVMEVNESILSGDTVLGVTQQPAAQCICYDFDFDGYCAFKIINSDLS